MAQNLPGRKNKNNIPSEIVNAELFKLTVEKNFKQRERQKIFLGQFFWWNTSQVAVSSGGRITAKFVFQDVTKYEVALVSNYGVCV